MAKKTSKIMVFITCENFEEAQKISERLLDNRLVACTNSIKDVSSAYWWKGVVEKSTEILVVAKTRSDLFKKVVAEVKKVHSYSVPEIIAIPIIDGNPDYLKWIGDSTK